MTTKLSLAAMLALGLALGTGSPSLAQQPGPQTGMGPGMMGGGPGIGMQQRGSRWANVTPEQREAFINLRIANIKAALKLTPDQEKLWPPVESAIRDSAKTMAERAQQRATQPKPADPIAALRAGAEAMTARAATMQRLADAAQPLYATLSDEQKARVPQIFRSGFGPGGGRAMRMMREGWDGHHGWGWMREHHRGWWNRD